MQQPMLLGSSKVPAHTYGNLATEQTMSKNGRIKRVTDPLDDKVKARIIGGGGSGDLRELGYVSSGSEHSAESISPSFSGFIFGFPDDVSAQQNHSPENDSDSESGGSAEELQLPQLNFQNDTDIFQNVLHSHVYKALEVFSNINNKSVLRRSVMTCLRDYGYNAAICKAKWESSGGLTAGNYEYIDIIRTDSNNRQTRYFIDLDFAAEFEMARPTKYYERLIQSLPKVFVGKSDVLNQILRIMSDAARRSLKIRQLHLPPWRKYRFMHHKFLGPYKRTTNLIPSPMNTTANFNQAYAVNCGFDAVNGGLWLPSATMTR